MIVSTGRFRLMLCGMETAAWRSRSKAAVPPGRAGRFFEALEQKNHFRSDEGLTCQSFIKKGVEKLFRHPEMPALAEAKQALFFFHSISRRNWPV